LRGKNPIYALSPSFFCKFTNKYYGLTSVGNAKNEKKNQGMERNENRTKKNLEL